jgi:ketosteroid isomerase-like protein
MTDDIDTFLSAWTAAELAGETEKLAGLLTDDFYGVGPLGFVLPRPAWLGRHEQGLDYEAFDLDEVQVHLYGDLGLVIARNNTRGTHRGRPIPEAVRATLVIPADSGRRRLAAIHMSYIAGTPGAPTLPGPTNPLPGSARPGRDGGAGATGADTGGRP